MIKIEKLIQAISEGVSEHSGCADGEKKLTRTWIKLAKSRNAKNHKRLLEEVMERVAYG